MTKGMQDIYSVPTSCTSIQPLGKYLPPQGALPAVKQVLGPKSVLREKFPFSPYFFHPTGVKVLVVLSWLLYVVVVPNPQPPIPLHGSAPQGCDSLTLSDEPRPLTDLALCGSNLGPCPNLIIEHPVFSHPSPEVWSSVLFQGLDFPR